MYIYCLIISLSLSPSPSGIPIYTHIWIICVCIYIYMANINVNNAGGGKKAGLQVPWGDDIRIHLQKQKQVKHGQTEIQTCNAEPYHQFRRNTTYIDFWQLKMATAYHVWWEWHGACYHSSIPGSATALATILIKFAWANNNIRIRT